MDPLPSWIERLWDAWDIRLLVLLSLALQIILIILGDRRRYIPGLWIRIIVWSAYLSANWVAAVALGKLSEFDAWGDSKNNDNHGAPDTDHLVRVLWAPLLLLHLGGPDTISAYSMEDNQLWLRHAFGLATQAVVVIYIFLRCWTGSLISILAFPMFVAGIIKYGERVWVLWSTNREKPGYTPAPATATCPSFFYKQTASSLIQLGNEEIEADWVKGIPGLQLLLSGYFLFQIWKPHIANYVIGLSEVDSVIQLTNNNRVECFQLVYKAIKFEVGFMYDVLYTKAAIIYTRAGCILRSISIFCTVSVLLGFSIITKDDYSNSDVFITYVLLVGAVVLDIYATILILYSDWAILWMAKHHKMPLVTRILRLIIPHSLNKRRRWSNSVPQFNLIHFCLLDKEIKPTLFIRILKFFGMYEKFKEYQCQTRSNEIEDLIQLLDKEVSANSRGTIFAAQKPYVLRYSERGARALEKCDHRLDDMERSVRQDFDTSIIVWHIVTDICYHAEDTKEVSQISKTAKLMSDYMMYLLVKRPYFLSIAIWHFMFKITYDDIKTDIEDITDKADARETLRKKWSAKETLLRSSLEQGENKETTSEERSAVVAARLANTLLGSPDRWNIMTEVWIEMLCYAATQSQVNQHAQELRRGGEFLTHVWLLLTQTFQTEKTNKILVEMGRPHPGTSSRALLQSTSAREMQARQRRE